MTAHRRHILLFLRRITVSRSHSFSTEDLMNTALGFTNTLAWKRRLDMGALLDMTKYIELWLSERGLNPEEISRGMRLLLGEDWNQISSSELFDRFRAEGTVISNKMPMFADELEALVRGALKMEDISGNRRSLF